MLFTVLALHLGLQQPQVLVQLDRSEIFEGESVDYVVFLNNFEAGEAPLLEGFDDFQIQPRGHADVNEVTIINGRQSTRRGRRYHFQLTPIKSGTLTIPAPKAKAEGKLIVGTEKVLKVIPPADQEIALLEISLDPPAVYPMQKFRVVLDVLIHPLPEPYINHEPISVQEPVRLSIPWSQADAEDGLQPTLDTRRWLEGIQGRRVGFAVEGIVSRRDIFDIFGDRTSVFRPRPTRVSRKKDDGETVSYWQYRWTREFRSIQTRDISFGPVTLKGVFGSGVDNRGELVGKQIFAVARPELLRVKRVPEEGKPESFIGAVGKFSFETEAAPLSLKVGDPMTLTLTMRGEGNLEEATVPDLTKLDAFAGFRVHDATDQLKGNTRQFTFSIRPKHEGINSVPSIPVAFFDVDSEQYVTVNTDPIEISVAATEVLSEDQIVSNLPPTSGDLELQSGGIFANITDLQLVRDQTVRPQRWFALLASLFGIYVLAALVTLRSRSRRENPAARRRRAAAGRAKQSMKQAQLAEDAGDTDRAVDQLQAAFAGLLADVDNVTQEAITGGDLKRRLGELGISPSLADRAAALFEQCTEHRFGAATDRPDRLSSVGDELLSELVSEMKQKKLFR